MRQKLQAHILDFVNAHERAETNIMLFSGFAYLLIIYRDRTLGYRFNVVDDNIVTTECEPDKIRETIKDMCKIQ